jgi:hypothetical protein
MPRTATLALLLVALLLLALTACDDATPPPRSDAPGLDVGGKADGFDDDDVCENADGGIGGLPPGEDLGFRPAKVAGRYRERCVDATGVEGLNPNCLGVCGDLRGADLRGMDLRLVRLAGADLSDADLAGTMWGDDVAATTARSAVFDRADLTGAWFQAADISRASFRGATLRDAVFADTFASYADFRNANLRHAWWAESSMNFVDLRGANAGGAWGFEAMNNCFAPTYCLMHALFDSTTILPFSRHPREWKMVKVPADRLELYNLGENLGFDGEIPFATAKKVAAGGVLGGGFLVLQYWAFDDEDAATVTLVHRRRDGVELGRATFRPTADLLEALPLTAFVGQPLAGTWELEADGSGVLMAWRLALGQRASASP